MAQNQNFATYVQNAGGSQSLLNQAATVQVKNSKGVLRRIVVETAGSGGSLTLNDLQIGGTPAAGNQVITLTNTQLNAIVTANNGGPVVLDLPFMKGIMVSAIPTGSALSYFFD